MENNAGQRKMARRLEATVGGYHGAGPTKKAVPGFSTGKKIARAIKKRIKTRENRAQKRGEL